MAHAKCVSFVESSLRVRRLLSWLRTFGRRRLCHRESQSCGKCRLFFHECRRHTNTRTHIESIAGIKAYITIYKNGYIWSRVSSTLLFYIFVAVANMKRCSPSCAPVTANTFALTKQRHKVGEIVVPMASVRLYIFLSISKITSADELSLNVSLSIRFYRMVGVWPRARTLTFARVGRKHCERARRPKGVDAHEFASCAGHTHMRANSSRNECDMRRYEATRDTGSTRSCSRMRMFDV